MEIQELKKIEGQKVEFFYRGKYRPFILQAVQDKEPCGCKVVSENCNKNHLINGKYQGDLNEIRLDYNYPKKSGAFREEGFWTNKTNLVRLPNAT